jgi:short-subunit dehydrogenase
VISRNEQKIKEKLKNIHTKTRCVVADMGKMASYQDYAKIAKELEDIDIGMLILNAGAMLMGDFK